MLDTPPPWIGTRLPSDIDPMADKIAKMMKKAPAPRPTFRSVIVLRFGLLPYLRIDKRFVVFKARGMRARIAVWPGLPTTRRVAVTLKGVARLNKTYLKEAIGEASLLDTVGPNTQAAVGAITSSRSSSVAVCLS